MQLEFNSIGAADQLWPIVIEQLELQSAVLLSRNYYDYGRRVYATENYVYKIVLPAHEITSRLRNQSLKGEYEILKKLSGISGVPAAVEWKKSADYELLVLERVNGGKVEKLGMMCFLVVAFKLSIVVIHSCFRGVSHSDIRLDNVLSTTKNNVSLIDYDQAVLTDVFSGLMRSFFGFKMGKDKVYGDFMTLIKEYLRARLPRWFLTRLSKFWKVDTDNTLPVLQENASSNLKLLLKAWQIAQKSDASAPNIIVAYYSFDFEGCHFPGERPWEKRWQVLRSITDYSDKRILELGCNMSLLSCFLIREENASAAMSVDVDENILKAAKIVSTALNVNPAYKQKDFDSDENWEAELIEYKPDIVFALNVLNWVNKKDRFLNFLGQFEQVIFEGHDSFEIEQERFRTQGFSEISLVSITERNRPVMFCQK